MAAATTTASLPSLLTTLTESLTSATSSLPSAPQSDSPPSLPTPAPPGDGISLLDSKNDLLLSYLQNLVFLIILKLRHLRGGEGASAISDRDDGGDGRPILISGDEVVRKLVEMRVYLEKGVRPLEGRLRYQIEKVVRAAEGEAERDRDRSAARSLKKKKSGLIGPGGGGGVSSNGVKATEEGSDTSSDSDADSAGGPEEDTTASSLENGMPPEEIDDLSYRPNPSALLSSLRKSQPSSESIQSASRSSNKTPTYKPPRITPTSMPTTTSTTNPDSHSTPLLQNRKSHHHLLDEYISSELSTAPATEPSIGSNSTILNRGRGALSARERDREKERTEYEEGNFSRLPRESKAERRKNNSNRGRDGGRVGFGGEDWNGLGEVGDRVARSVGKGREGRVKAKEGVLERREKRKREGGDGGAGGAGMGIGESFERRRKVMEGRAEKKQRRKG